MGEGIREQHDITQFARFDGSGGGTDESTRADKSTGNDDVGDTSGAAMVELAGGDGAGSTFFAAPTSVGTGHVEATRQRQDGQRPEPPKLRAQRQGLKSRPKQSLGPRPNAVHQPSASSFEP